MQKTCCVISVFFMMLFCFGCNTYESRVKNAPGRRTNYFDTTTKGPVVGVGIEHQDINSMTDKMVRSMLRNKVLAGQTVSPRVLLEAK